MQCYALMKALNEHLECDIEIIDYNSKKSYKYYIKDILNKFNILKLMI